jgi:hypothetical protein
VPLDFLGHPEILVQVVPWECPDSPEQLDLPARRVKLDRLVWRALLELPDLQVGLVLLVLPELLVPVELVAMLDTLEQLVKRAGRDRKDLPVIRVSMEHRELLEAQVSQDLPVRRVAVVMPGLPELEEQPVQ